MKYLKLFDNKQDYSEYDPFGEEDWDEVDIFVVKKYLDKLKNKKLNIFDIPDNIIRHFDYPIFEYVNNLSDIIKLYLIIQDSDEFNLNHIWRTIITKKIKNIKDFNYLLEFKNKIDNFDDYIKYNIGRFTNISLDITKKILNLLENVDIYDNILDEHNILSNMNGKNLYKLIQSIDSDFFLDYNKLDIDVLEYSSMTELISILYENDKVDDNTFSLLCANMHSKKNYYQQFIESLGTYNDNGEYFIIFDDFDDLEQYFVDDIKLVDYHDMFMDNYYDSNWDEFYHLLNSSSIEYLSKIFIKNNIGNFKSYDYIIENIKHYEKINHPNYSKLKNYISEIISKGENDDIDTNFEFDEITDIISISGSHSQSSADADNYFDILINELEGIFPTWKENGKVFKWKDNKNGITKLCVKVDLYFINSLELNYLVDYIGFDFNFHDIFDHWIDEINGKLEPNLDYIHGNIDIDYFNEMILDELSDKL